MSFTAELRRSSSPAWERAVRHRFVIELGAGTLPLEKFERYFLQDYIFVDELRRVTGLAVARAPDIELARRCGEFLAVLLGAEDALFRRAFDSLGVPRDRYQGAAALPVTRAFGDFLVRTAYEGTFEQICCALYVTEGVYLDWASRLRQDGARPGVAIYQEWIDIHDQAALGPFVSFVQGVVDAGSYGPGERRRMNEIFATTLEYEARFWDMAYEGGAAEEHAGRGGRR